MLKNDPPGAATPLNVGPEWPRGLKLGCCRQRSAVRFPVAGLQDQHSKPSSDRSISVQTSNLPATFPSMLAKHAAMVEAERRATHALPADRDHGMHAPDYLEEVDFQYQAILKESGGKKRKKRGKAQRGSSSAPASSSIAAAPENEVLAERPWLAKDKGISLEEFGVEEDEIDSDMRRKWLKDYEERERKTQEHRSAQAFKLASLFNDVDPETLLKEAGVPLPSAMERAQERVTIMDREIDAMVGHNISQENAHKHVLERYKFQLAQQKRDFKRLSKEQHEKKLREGEAQKKASDKKYEDNLKKWFYRANLDREGPVYKKKQERGKKYSEARRAKKRAEKLAARQAAAAET